MSTTETHEATYSVVGMTCDHCARSVTTEVSALDGVRDVQVDLGAGEVRVTAERPLEAHQVRAAVEEAGYRLD